MLHMELYCLKCRHNYNTSYLGGRLADCSSCGSGQLVGLVNLSHDKPWAMMLLRSTNQRHGRGIHLRPEAWFEKGMESC